MDQQQRFDAIIDRISAATSMQAVSIPPELAQPKAFMKVMQANHFNWHADKFEKVFGMRMSLKVPPLQQLNVICYPSVDYELPIFIFFCLVTRRKVIAHLNVNCPFSDDDYQTRYVEPLTTILERFDSFETKDRYPQWMKKYRNDCTIYGMYRGDRIDDISDCMFAYLDIYLQQAQRASPLEDEQKRAAVTAFHAQFREDIRTQDKAQGMMAKLIGADTAKRIFYEVTT